MTTDSYQHATAEADARARFAPSPGQLLVAAAELDTYTDTDTKAIAVVPIALPGKEFGVWTVGQPVEHLPGACWLGLSPAADGQTIIRARDSAIDAARTALAGRPGTIAWVAIGPKGVISVNEDFGAAERANMAGVRAYPDGGPIPRDDYAATLEKQLDEAAGGQVRLSKAEATVIAELLDELSAVYHNEDLGRMARTMAVRLYDGLGI